jgi:hopanoid biosynthesis associated RND transporter like protein HpnN
MSLSRLLAAVVGHSRRNALLMVVAGVLIAAASSWLAATHLGLSTDTDLLFSDKLPWRQRQIAWNKDFPQSQDLLVAVVDGTVPEIADQTASNLAAELSPDHTHFEEIWRPDASPYLEQNGLMFLDEKALSGLLDQTIDAQPFLGQLVADPSARGLFAALGLVAMGAERGEAELGPFADSLKAFHQALAAAAAGHPEPLSWQNLLAGSLASQGGPYRFVLIRPHLDYGALSPGGAATQAIRDAAARLEFVRSGQAHVRITGSVALADEEFATVAQGAVAGTIISAILIALWLLLAVRTWRLIVPILYTLLLGLAVTMGFATIAVGTLNLISVAFAILFVGIAVDFAIQFSVRYRAERLAAVDAATGLAQTAERVGPQILVAAAATAAGFLAFVPTDFSGVAELGLIAGGGMVIAFFCTIIFLPAALTLLRPRPGARAVGFHWGDPVERWLRRNRRVVLTGFAVLGVLGAVLLPRLTFDSDPLHTKNPNTEAMRTLADLMSSPLTNPYSIDILTPSLDAANALAAKLRPLSLVDSVLTLSSFVPEDQNAKLALIADAANILGPTLSASPASAPVTAADLRMSAQTTRDQIEKALPKLPKDSPLVPIAEDLRVLSNAPDATLLAANTALTRFLPAMVDRLRHVLDAKPVTISDVPHQIARDWILPDGRARVQVMPKPAARGSRGLHEFVGQVQAIAPDAGGSAVTIVETAATIVGAFRSAAIGALIAIAVILSLVLRRALDVALVMAPLVLSALLTVVFAVLLPLPLNFANIIALPLLLGVGVSFNIYFVMNWRTGARRFLGTATARAIVFSALTTATAFGSLALSAHPGTASMGKLLMLSLGCTLMTTLFFVPTLLGVLGPMIVRRRHAMA